MKYLKLICLIVLGLGLQGCESEVPLLKKNDSFDPTKESIVILNMYTTKVQEAGAIHNLESSPLYFYASWESVDQDQQFDFKNFNHTRAKDQAKKYVIAKIKPGAYYVANVYAYGESSTYTLPIGPLKYRDDTSPLTFTVNPGDVKYLGDIEFEEEEKTKMPKFKIHRCFDDAKKFIQINYKHLSDKLTEGNFIINEQTVNTHENMTTREKKTKIYIHRY